MSSHEQEYGQYYGTKHNPTGEFHQISSSADKQSSGLIDSLGLNIVFLEKKYKEDLNEAQSWNAITRAASIAGYALILMGIIIVFFLSIHLSLAIGMVDGGLTSLSGIIFYVFTNLIANPARIFNEQVKEDVRLLSEAHKLITTISQREIEIEQFNKSIAGLPKQEQQEMRKRYIEKKFDLSE